MPRLIVPPEDLTTLAVIAEADLPAKSNGFTTGQIDVADVATGLD